MEFELVKDFKKKVFDDLHGVYASAFNKSLLQILTKDDFKDFFDMGAKIYLLKKDYNIIGYIVVSINREIAEIFSIGISMPHQKKGYGKILLDRLVKSNSNILKITLEVSELNYQAIKFYKTYGFSLIATRKNYYLIRKGINKGIKIDALLFEYKVS